MRSSTHHARSNVQSSSGLSMRGLAVLTDLPTLAAGVQGALKRRCADLNNKWSALRSTWKGESFGHELLARPSGSSLLDDQPLTLSEGPARKRHRASAEHEASRVFSTTTNENNQRALLQPFPPSLTPPHVSATTSAQPKAAAHTSLARQSQSSLLGVEPSTPSGYGLSATEILERLWDLKKQGQHDAVAPGTLAFRPSSLQQHPRALAASLPTCSHSDLRWRDSQLMTTMPQPVSALVSELPKPLSEQSDVVSQPLRSTWKGEGFGHEALARQSRSSLLGVEPSTSSGCGLSATDILKRLRELRGQEQHNSAAPSKKHVHHDAEQSQQACATRSQVNSTGNAALASKSCTRDDHRINSDDVSRLAEPSPKSATSIDHALNKSVLDKAEPFERTYPPRVQSHEAPEFDSVTALQPSAHGPSVLHDSSCHIKPSVSDHLAATVPSRLYSDLGWRHSQLTAARRKEQEQHDAAAPSEKHAHHDAEQSRQVSAMRSHIDIPRSAVASHSQAQVGPGKASPSHRSLSALPSALRTPKSPRHRKRRVSWSLPPQPPL